MCRALSSSTLLCELSAPSPRLLSCNPPHVLQVLSRNGHVVVVNSNPAMAPLVREAARLNLNSHVWFWSEPWPAGALGGGPAAATAAPGGETSGDADVEGGTAARRVPRRADAPCPLMTSRAQPSRTMLLRRGLAMRNPLARADAGGGGAGRGRAVPHLSGADMQRLMALARPPTGRRAEPAERWLQGRSRQVRLSIEY
jgi:hypothetical protein